jgi:hypothetical protein
MVEARATAKAMAAIADGM